MVFHPLLHVSSTMPLTKPLTDSILSHDQSYPYEVLADQINLKNTIRVTRHQLEAEKVRESITPSLQLAMDLPREKGASSWLTTLPLEEHGFTLHKTAFRDAMALRSGWLPSNIPSTCICGHSFSVQHALSCRRGGFL